MSEHFVSCGDEDEEDRNEGNGFVRQNVFKSQSQLGRHLIGTVTIPLLVRVLSM